MFGTEKGNYRVESTYRKTGAVTSGEAVLSKEVAQQTADYSNKKHGALLHSEVKEGPQPPRPDLMSEARCEPVARL